MKKFATLIALLPGSAMAHGMHAPVEPNLHAFAHIVPGAIVIGMVVALGLIWRARQ